jgi:hypothetical protein
MALPLATKALLPQIRIPSGPERYAITEVLPGAQADVRAYAAVIHDVPAGDDGR